MIQQNPQGKLWKTGAVDFGENYKGTVDHR